MTCSALTAHNLQVGWLPPAPHLAHGLIQGYRLVYEPADDDGQQGELLSFSSFSSPDMSA